MNFIIREILVIEFLSFWGGFRLISILRGAGRPIGGGAAHGLEGWSWIPPNHTEPSGPPAGSGPNWRGCGWRHSRHGGGRFRNNRHRPADAASAQRLRRGARRIPPGRRRPMSRRRPARRG